MTNPQVLRIRPMRLWNS